MCKNRFVIIFWGLKYDISEAEHIGHTTVVSANWRLYCTTLFNEDVFAFFFFFQKKFCQACLTQIVTRCCRYNEYKTITSKNYRLYYYPDSFYKHTKLCKYCSKSNYFSLVVRHQ